MDDGMIATAKTEGTILHDLTYALCVDEHLVYTSQDGEWTNVVTHRRERLKRKWKRKRDAHKVQGILQYGNRSAHHTLFSLTVRRRRACKGGAVDVLHLQLTGRAPTLASLTCAALPRQSKGLIL
jgi:hypothetical protein